MILAKSLIIRTCFAHGRWASCLLPGSFGSYQNLLRMILIGIATLTTAPKEARPQALFRFFRLQMRYGGIACFFRLQKMKCR